MERRESQIVRWADICKVLRLMGEMKSFSKTECLQVNKRLVEQIKKGKVEKVSRGRYRMI
jgi:hypothetical protein